MNRATTFWFAADRAVRDARTTESGLRDLRTQSGREWSRNRLYGMRRKCIRHKPQKRRENSTDHRIYGVFWGGAKYAVNDKIDLMGAVYYAQQNNYAQGRSSAQNRPCRPLASALTH